MKRKNHHALLSILAIVVLSIVSLIYLSINRALDSIEKKGDIITPNKQPTYHFALISENEDDPYWQAIKKGVEKASLEFNVAVEFNEPSKLDFNEMSKFIDIAIASKVDGIATFVWDEKQASEYINRSVNKGIPVVTIGSDAKDSKRNGFIGINAYATGTKLGKLILKSQSHGEVAILVNNQSVGVSKNLIISGIKDAVKSNSSINIASVLYNVENVISLEDKIKDLINNQPNLKTIICTTARDTLVLTQRLIDLNKLNYTIIGYGDTAEILRYIQNGIIYGTVTADHEQIGFESIRSLIDIKNNKRISDHISVNMLSITKNNIKEYIKKSGEK